MEFLEFPKMARMSRECIITEKIDGTNAQVYIKELDGYPIDDPYCIAQCDGLAMFAGSRTRWITPENDNYGFAKWVKDNSSDLFLLGPGRHFGEWWGYGIQRKYGMKEKAFSLFNVSRWDNESSRPSCCRLVPVLYRGLFNTKAVEDALGNLVAGGSIAAPGFMDPEGVVVYHVAAGIGFKKTVQNDDIPKSKHK